MEIGVGRLLCTTEYDYPTFHLTMHCYLCHITEGTPQLTEHLEARWLSPEELYSVQWLPADVEVVECLNGTPFNSPSMGRTQGPLNLNTINKEPAYLSSPEALPIEGADAEGASVALTETLVSQKRLACELTKGRGGLLC